tara:strand:- start:2692 stop:2949 length:258 start_codon:yes stop_codon:yes gene_type:complete
MLNALKVQFINKRCEITKSVFGAVIELNLTQRDTRLTQQPLRILLVAATTNDQRQTQIPGQSNPNMLTINISSQHQDQLRRVPVN